MAKKPIFKTLWAERGAKEEVDSSKIAVGWTAERPPFQWENWSQWRQDAFISHINERGISEWDDFTSYGVSGKSYVSGSNGEVYVSTAPSGGTYPPSNPTELSSTKWKKAWLDSDGTIGIPRVVGLVAALDNKVDKVAGKDLSANDFTNAYRGKVDGIESGAHRNVPTNLTSSRTTSSVSIGSSTGDSTIIPTASTSLAGVLAGTDKAKLNSLPFGVSGVVPLSGGGTGSSNASGARLSLQLGNHATHSYGFENNTVMMGNDPRVVGVAQQITDGLSTKADKATNINTGVGLVGGGSLSSSRTISANFGITSGTVVEGNDSRVVNAASRAELMSGLSLKADAAINIVAGVGLSGGGSLSSNRTIAANFGSEAGTVVQGNDARVNNGQSAFSRLDIGATATTARAALGLGSASLLSKEDIMPIGSTYIQFPDKAAPSSLHGGTWTLQYNTEGVFFRTEGGGASAFGAGVQGDDTKPHRHTATAIASGGHTHTRGTMNITASLGNTRYTAASASGAAYLAGGRALDHGVDNDYRQNGYSSWNFDASRDWTGETSVSGSHSHSVSVDNSVGIETRPRNRTIRVWLRTS